CSCVVGAGCSGVDCVRESLNDRFAALRSNQKEVYHVGLAQKYTETLEEDLGTEKKPVKTIYTADNITEVSGSTRIKGYRMNIYLKEGAVQVKARPFRLGWENQDTMDKYIDEMLELDLIEKPTGIFSSPSFLVDKRDGFKRCVIDYRKLNKLILCTKYPTPTVTELTEAYAGATVFTSCDCTSEYHQLELNPDHAEYTAFVTNRGVFKYKVLPMGISPGCSEFQRVVSDIFRDYIGKFVLVFLDDMLVYSKTQEVHVEHLRLVFEACERANLKLKRAKCTFMASSTTYLGHSLTSEGSTLADYNKEKILGFQRPESAALLRSFLGTCNYFRKYVRGYASIVVCLNKLTRKNTTFVWNEEHEAAFNTLKTVLCSEPVVLAYPARDRYFILYVDASNLGLGAVLTQVDDQESMANEKVVAYASRGLRGAESRYHIHHLEAMSVVWGIGYFKHFLKGTRFLLVVDNYEFGADL
ncbi:Transposon Ty3-G Gag-Pol polyprotein, partial [Choanephora cucurbitarum]